MILTGKTRTGKSTAIGLLKQAMCLDVDTRKIDAKRTTMQPFTDAACMRTFLHVEEYTGQIHEDKESLIRSIINCAATSTGMNNGKNIMKLLRSTLIIDGERAPEGESVMNRLIVVPFLTGDRRGIQTDIIDLSCKSFLIDFMSSIYAVTREEEIKHFKNATMDAELLGSQDQRTKQIYRYLFYLNRILDLETPEMLSKKILENVDMITGLTPERNPILDMFMHIMNETKMKPRFEHTQDGT